MKLFSCSAPCGAYRINSGNARLLPCRDALRGDGSKPALLRCRSYRIVHGYDFAPAVAAQIACECSGRSTRKTAEYHSSYRSGSPPDKDTAPAVYTTIEMLFDLSMPGCHFHARTGLHPFDHSIFKMVGLDEAWAFLNNVFFEANNGNKLVRAGRSMNTAVTVTQERW